MWCCIAWGSFTWGVVCEEESSGIFRFRTSVLHFLCLRNCKQTQQRTKFYKHDGSRGLGGTTNHGETSFKTDYAYGENTTDHLAYIMSHGLKTTQDLASICYQNSTSQGWKLNTSVTLRKIQARRLNGTLATTCWIILRSGQLNIQMIVYQLPHFWCVYLKHTFAKLNSNSNLTVLPLFYPNSHLKPTRISFNSNCNLDESWV